MDEKTANALKAWSENVREVSKRYYDAQRSSRYPTTYGMGQALSRRHRFSLFHCDACGKYYEYPNNMYPRPFKEYSNQEYCLPCWEKKQQELKEPCPDCGKLLSIYEHLNHYTGRCRECWIKRLQKLRENYSEYRVLLERLLAERGIKLNPAYTDGLDETGRPPARVNDEKLDMLPLRDDEYALYLFDVKDGTFAFPNNGIGLRYLKTSTDQKLMSACKASGGLLSAGSDGTDLYALTEIGELISTNPDIVKNPEHTDVQKVQIIDPVSFCLKEAKKYFTEEQIAAAVAAFCENGIVSVHNSIYYDPAEKSFFMVLTDGNMYHGFDVEYAAMRKEEVIKWHIRFHFSIYDSIEMCRAGKIPMLVILVHLPDREGGYAPPDNFGYGVEFI